MSNQYKNYGVKLGEFSPTTYVGGTLPYEIRNPSGDWTPYLPKGEKQFGKEDWMDCVSRSLTNSVEVQHKFFTKEEVNYSDRFLAKRSGTTRQGNYLDRVAESARKDGLILQEYYPDTDGSWDEQYVEIPNLNELLFEGQKFLKDWYIKYERVPFDPTSLKYHLKHAPLQVIVPGHAVVDIYNDGAIDKIFDSYEPWIKQVPGSKYGEIIYAMKIVLYKRETSEENLLLVDLHYGDKGAYVVKFKNLLKKLWDDREFNDSDEYDDNLKEIVFNFQLANLPHSGWSYWWNLFFYRGRRVDFETREVINQSLKYY